MPKSSLEPKEAVADSRTSALLSCSGCRGHSLTLRGKVVQCDDCGAIQADWFITQPLRNVKETVRNAEIA